MVTNKEEIIGIINSTNMELAVKKYLEILEIFNTSADVSQDLIFQKKYNYFYRVMKKKKEFYIEYYSYMNECKQENINNIDFPSVFSHFKEKFGRDEASFSSKLLHTLNNDSPIIDSIVLKNLNLLKEYRRKNSNKIDIYNKVVSIYKSLLIDNHYIIDEFDKKFSKEKNSISNTKKIDFILWQTR